MRFFLKVGSWFLCVFSSLDLGFLWILVKHVGGFLGESEGS